MALTVAPRAAAYGLAACLAAAIALSLPVLQREHRSATQEALTAFDMQGPYPLPWEDADDPGACDAACPPRAAAAAGARLANEAMRAGDPSARRGKALQAEALLTQALKARPASGEWWAWLAFARIGAREPVDQVAQALAESYRRSPYLAHLALWRIGLAARLWVFLPGSARQAAVEETAWMKAGASPDIQAVADAADDPAAHEALQAALRRPVPPSVPHGVGGGPGGVGFRR